jgi:hypothetical protein
VDLIPIEQAKPHIKAAIAQGIELWSNNLQTLSKILSCKQRLWMKFYF